MVFAQTDSALQEHFLRCLHSVWETGRGKEPLSLGVIACQAAPDRCDLRNFLGNNGMQLQVSLQSTSIYVSFSRNTVTFAGPGDKLIVSTSLGLWWGWGL